MIERERDYIKILTMYVILFTIILAYLAVKKIERLCR